MQRQQELPTLAKALADHHAAWLACSLEEMRKLRGDGTLPHEQLVDCLPLFLEQLCVGLETDPAKPDRHGPNAARAHGSQRHAVGLDVDTLIREYACVLRSAMTLCSADGQIVAAEEVSDLAQLLISAAGDAVNEYHKREAVQRRDAERERLGFLAHEIKNPLASARVALELLRDTSKSDAALVALARSVDTAAERADQALSQVRIEAMTSDTLHELEEVEVVDLVCDARADAAVLARTKMISLRVDASDTDALKVRGDFRVLLSALSNLVRNAVKFTREGGSITIHSRREEGRVLVEVHDQCGGLSPGRAEHIFRSFTQSGQDRSGFGLGLAIAHRAITACGGTLMVRNVTGHGCVFIADLPASD